ncbi:MAG: molecular chaperone HtpG [Flexilinea sp.]
MAKAKSNKQNEFPFKAETKQLLDILINSLYSDWDVFLREIISNASDALTRINFEMLTNHDVVDPDAAPAIHIYADKEAGTLRITDNGIGMNADEMVDNLGTIAKSGARNFLEATKDKPAGSVNDLIGQFGVGFYAAFMVAEWIDVTSRSYRPEDKAAKWHSSGSGSFTIIDADKTDRGSEILIKLKEDAKDYTEEFKLREIVRKHSNYIPYPIYFGDSTEQINAETTIWRQNPSEVKDEDYEKFYQNFTLDFEKPLNRLHLSIDAPFQMYALLYIPSKPERTMFSLRKEDGLQLFARKVLIQDYCTNLLPRYYRFIEGVIDSEDIPLNVSRETMQANRVVLTLKKILAGKITDVLKKWGTEDKEKYTEFWKKFGVFICEGIVTESDAKESLVPLLRYRSLNHGNDYISLADYVLEMKPGQDKVYYVLGDNLETLRNSPHIETLRKKGLDVLLLIDPFDPFVITNLEKYQDFNLVNAASEKFSDEKDKENSEDNKEPALDETTSQSLIQRFKDELGDKVSDVKVTDRLVESPARLADAEGAISPEMQRMYQLMQQEFNAPKKVLEINPEHPLITRLAKLQDKELSAQIINQVFDGAKIMEGETPDQFTMLNRIQNLIINLLDQKKE